MNRSKMVTVYNTRLYKKIVNEGKVDLVKDIVSQGFGLPYAFTQKYKDQFQPLRMTDEGVVELIVAPEAPIEPVYGEYPLQVDDIQRKFGRKRNAAVKSKGVTWDGRRWVARFEGKYLGKFVDPRDAAKAYKDAAEGKYGEGGAEL